MDLSWKDTAGLSAYVCWEFFLGRTRRIRANSTLELVLNMTARAAIKARSWVRHRKKGA